MTVHLVVAVTDSDWFEHLRRRPDLPEVNFWAPSANPFRALQPGELFLFKLHAPRNYIVGGGVFAYANMLPCSLAWEAFGEANGAGTSLKCGHGSRSTGVPTLSTAATSPLAAASCPNRSSSKRRTG